MLTVVKGFTYFTTIVPIMTEDSDSVVCVVEVLKVWLVFLVVILNCEDIPFAIIGGVSERVKQPLLLCHSMTTVKLSALNILPVILSHRISG